MPVPSSPAPPGEGGGGGGRARRALVAAAAVVALLVLAGPLQIAPIGHLGAGGQTATTDVFALDTSGHPAPATAPPSQAWNYQPEGTLVSLDVGPQLLYVLQQRGASLEVVAVRLDDGSEAWRRTLLGAEQAQIRADGDQLLVVEASSGGSGGNGGGSGGQGGNGGGPGGGSGGQGGNGAQGGSIDDDSGARIVVEALDASTSDERWTTPVSASETVSSVGRWLVIRPRPAADGSVAPGTVRVFDRRSGQLRWSRPDATAPDLGRDESILADADGLALVTMSTGAELQRLPDPRDSRPFVAAEHAVGVATPSGLVFPTFGASSAQFIGVIGLEPSSARRLDDNITLVSVGDEVEAIDRRLPSEVDLAGADADGLYGIGSGTDVRLLFSWSDHFVAVDPDGGNRRERSFTTGDRKVAGFAGWLAYTCEGRSGVAAYDVRTLQKLWRVTVADRPSTDCSVIPVADGFLTIEAGVLRAYR